MFACPRSVVVPSGGAVELIPDDGTVSPAGTSAGGVAADEEADGDALGDADDPPLLCVVIR
jgi:hypothetical protein